MIELWIWPFIGGVLFGSLFFGGLLLTIVYGFKSPRPELWFLISLIVRMSLVISGFILISDGPLGEAPGLSVGILAGPRDHILSFPVPDESQQGSPEGDRECVSAVTS